MRPREEQGRAVIRALFKVLILCLAVPYVGRRRLQVHDGVFIEMSLLVARLRCFRLQYTQGKYLLYFSSSPTPPHHVFLTKVLKKTKYIYNKTNEMQSHYRPDQAQRVPGV